MAHALYIPDYKGCRHTLTIYMRITRIDFPRHEWLRERVSILRLYVNCLLVLLKVIVNPCCNHLLFSALLNRPEFSVCVG
jgi:hypothetical protein